MSSTFGYESAYGHGHAVCLSCAPGYTSKAESPTKCCRCSADIPAGARIGYGLDVRVVPACQMKEYPELRGAADNCAKVGAQ